MVNEGERIRTCVGWGDYPVGEVCDEIVDGDTSLADFGSEPASVLRSVFELIIEM